jgi:hypothetical protein
VADLLTKVTEGLLQQMDEEGLFLDGAFGQPEGFPECQTTVISTG